MNNNKWLKITIISVFSIALVAVAFVVIYFTILRPDVRDSGDDAIEFTREEVELEITVAGEAGSLFEKLREKEGEDVAIEKTLKWIRGQEGVSEAGEDVGCIWIEFKHGGDCLIVIPPAYLEPIDMEDRSEE